MRNGHLLEKETREKNVLKADTINFKQGFFKNWQKLLGFQQQEFILLIGRNYIFGQYH